jgi:hypothetical protein
MKISARSKSSFSISIFLISLFFNSAFSKTRKDISYFPLAIGIQWTYQCIEYSYTDTITIVDTQQVNDKLYYAVKENGYRYNWLRKDGDKIYIVDTAAVRLDTVNIKEYVVYDFSADIGESWDVPLINYYNNCDYGGTIGLISKNDTMTTSAGTFNKCYDFFHGSPCMDAGRHKEWFATGIGRVAYDEESIAGMRHFFLTSSSIITDVYNHDNSRVVSEFKLLQNYPNPFNPTTNIIFILSKRSFVIADIYDVLGRKITTLVNSYFNSGYHSVIWDASDHTSGVYFCKIYTHDFTQTIKLDLVR